MTINRNRPGANAHLLRRMHQEFLELPGLCLTLNQARRLWGVDRATCEDALTHLIESKFLARTGDGLYVRAPKALSLRTQSAA